MSVRARESRIRVESSVSGPSRTKQAFAEESDINVIAQKYLRDGVHPMVNRGAPRWGDFSDVEDFHTCLNRVKEAERLFSELPADLRAACRNDPAELMEMLGSEEGLDELEKLGIVTREDPDAQESEGEKASRDQGHVVRGVPAAVQRTEGKARREKAGPVPEPAGSGEDA